MNKFLLTILIFCFLFSCSPNKEQTNNNQLNTVKYAKNLAIYPNENYTTVEVTTTEDKTFTYILYKQEQAPSVKADAFIKVPIKSMACTSTSHLPAFDLLKAEERLIGFPSTEWIYDSTLVNSVKKGFLHDIGQKQGLNQEKLISLQPDVLMAYQMPGSNNDYGTLAQANIDVIYNADFLETTPLGRAEWMKLTAVLLEKETMADSVFNAIAQNYMDYKLKVAHLSSLPSVMTGLMYGDTWYVPGGNSFGSQFIADAAGHYLWNDNKASGSLTLGFENVLTRAKDAQYWIGIGSIESYDELAKTDERYTYFKAFENRKIYSYTKRVNAQGGNDYLESGYSRPDLILKDHIKILHPEIRFSQNAEFTYFQALK